MNNRVVHFELGAANPARAIEFYEKVFGWDIKKWEGGEEEYWLVMTGDMKKPGINGGIFKWQKEVTPSTGPEVAVNCVNTVDIPDIDDIIGKVKENGGEIIGEKMTIPKVGTMVHIRDTEGNLLGIMQAAPDAMPM
jgi:predicted enzyme related to lactoylglutathione lyase